MLTAEQKREISDRLESLVSEFNRAFSAWMEETGCRANFGWKYGHDKKLKELQIIDIDAMVYQKPDPKWARETEIKDLLNDHGTRIS